MEGQRPPASRRTGRRAFLRTGVLVAGAGLALPLLAACSSTPVTPAPPANAPAPSKPAETQARRGQPSRPPPRRPRAPASPSDVKLTAWFTDRRSINDMTEKEAMPEFQAKNPGINVEVQFVPEAQIQQKLLAAKAANNAPGPDRDRRDVRGHALEEQGAAADPAVGDGRPQGDGRQGGGPVQAAARPGPGRVLRPAERHLRRRPLLQRGAAGRAEVHPGADPDQVGRLLQVGQGHHHVEGQHARADRLRHLRDRGRPAPRVPRPEGRLAGRQPVPDQGEGRAEPRPRVRGDQVACWTSTTSTSWTRRTA